MDVKARIRGYVETAIREQIGDSEDFFERGAVSSLFAVQLVVFVEQEFSIPLEREDLVIHNFSSIDALTRFVLRKTGGAPQGDTP